MDRLEGIDPVDRVIALLQIVHDVDVLAEVAEILVVDIEDLPRQRRNLLRAIVAELNSERFELLAEVGLGRAQRVLAVVNQFLVAALPEVPEVEGAGALAEDAVDAAGLVAELENDADQQQQLAAQPAAPLPILQQPEAQPAAQPAAPPQILQQPADQLPIPQPPPLQQLPAPQQQQPAQLL